MSGPEAVYEPPQLDVAMCRLRYTPAERSRLKDQPAWYRLIPTDELDMVEDPDLRQQLKQQQQDIVNGSLDITLPTVYTDGRLSHVHHMQREFFRIPGHVVPGSEPAPKPSEPDRQRKSLKAVDWLQTMFRRQRPELNEHED